MDFVVPTSLQRGHEELRRATQAGGEVSTAMAEVQKFTDRLEAELPAMQEHQAIAGALQRLHEAATRAGRVDIVDFGRRPKAHARTEEEVMYPAAVLVGRYVRLRLGPTPQR